MIDELRRGGHEVHHVNPAAALGRYDDPAAYGEVTVKAVREFQAAGGCDMFFATAVDHSFLPETAREISRMGIPTVNLNMDDMSHPYRVRKITHAFDLVCTTDPTNMDVIRGYGARDLIHLPFAANPHVFHPAGPETERAFYFIGACYGARARAIAMLAQAGIPVRAYGSSPMDIYGDDVKSLPALRALFTFRDGWQRLVRSMAFSSGRACVRAALLRTIESTFRNTPEKHPAEGDVEFRPGPTFDEWSKVMGQAALSLGSLELASTFVLNKPLYFIRFREFEAAMAGCVHVASASEELKQYFEEDKEMLFYDGFDELVDKGRFYLDPKRDAERQNIREAARARSLAEHTWTHRFQSIVDQLGLPVRV